MKDVNLMEIDYVQGTSGDRRFTFERLNPPIIFSEEKRREATHVLKGFPDDLFLIIEPDCYYWGHVLGNTGFVRDLIDEEVRQEAFAILLHILKKSSEKKK